MTTLGVLLPYLYSYIVYQGDWVAHHDMHIIASLIVMCGCSCGWMFGIVEKWFGPRKFQNFRNFRNFQNFQNFQNFHNFHNFHNFQFQNFTALVMLSSHRCGIAERILLPVIMDNINTRIFLTTFIPRPGVLPGLFGPCRHAASPLLVYW